MYNFFKVLASSKKDSTKDILYSENNAQSLYRILCDFYIFNPDATDEEVYKYFSDMFKEFNENVLRFPTIRSSTIRYNVCKILNQSAKERREVYDWVINEEKEKGSEIFEKYKLEEYSSNRKMAKRQLALQSVDEIRVGKAAVPENVQKLLQDFFKLSKKEQSIRKGLMKVEERENINFLKDIVVGDEYTRYEAYLKRIEPKLEKLLKEDYIKSLSMLGNSFERLGLIDIYASKQDKMLEELEMDVLAYPAIKGGTDTISIRDLFDEENLKKLSINQLLVLNTFWLNRFTKELNSINKTFFIIKRLGLLDKIKEQASCEMGKYIKVPIPKEKLKKMHEKIGFLNTVTNIVMYDAEDLGCSYEIERIETDDVKCSIKKVDAYPLFKRLDRDMRKDYEEYFELEGVSSNLFDDMLEYRTIQNAKYNMYKLKDMNIIALLSNLCENSSSKNWGIILDERNKKDDRMVLIGVDIEGLNMPLRFHMEKNVVRDFLKAYQESTLIPVYEGGNDFVISRKNFSTQVLMPLCPKQKKGIRELLVQSNSYNKDFLEHLNFLSDGTFPEHLKTDVVTRKNGKAKITKKKPPKRYFDLDTDEEYVQRIDGKIEKVVDKNTTEKGIEHE